LHTAGAASATAFETYSNFKQHSKYCLLQLLHAAVNTNQAGGDCGVYLMVLPADNMWISG
jgi:hypothetical protein